LWLHGSGCQGDSISFLNLFADMPPVGPLAVDDVLANHVDLVYHTVLMAAAGPTAVDIAKQAREQGGYVLVLEGGVPTAFEGNACLVWSDERGPVTYQQAIEDLVHDASFVLSVGTCACYGGIVASGPDPLEGNPTGVVSATSLVQQLSPGKPVMNIPGCPAHPDWVAWVVVQLILGNTPALDGYLRPVELFGNKDLDRRSMNIHRNCPRRPGQPGSAGFASRFGEDFRCLELLGCRGPNTYADCPARKWNSGEQGPANWCVDSNGMCIGCVEPDFPGGDFYY
jgi:NiFe hydrogenase small subunit HydA